MVKTKESQRKKFVIIGDTFALYIVQISNFIIPIVTIPLLSTRLGTSGFGTYSLLLSIISYTNILIDFGFNITGPRNIAGTSTRREEQTLIFWNTLACKGILTFIILTIALPILYIVPDNRKISFILPLFSGILSALINPSWFFQGIGKIGQISYLMLFLRLIYLPTLYCFINSESDLSTAILLNQAPVLVASGCGLFILQRQGFIKFPNLNHLQIRKTFKDAFPFFSSGCFSSIYQTSHLVIVGAILGVHAAGIYALVEKLVRAMQALLTPFSSALYPHLVWAWKDGFPQFKTKARNLIFVTLSISILFILLSRFVMPKVLEYFFQDKFREAIKFLNYSSLTLIPYALSQSCTFILLALNKEIKLLRVSIVQCILGLPFLFISLSKWGLYGGITALLINEVFFASSLSRYVYTFFAAESGFYNLKQIDRRQID